MVEHHYASEAVFMCLIERKKTGKRSTGKRSSGKHSLNVTVSISFFIVFLKKINFLSNSHFNPYFRNQQKQFLYIQKKNQSMLIKKAFPKMYSLENL